MNQNNKELLAQEDKNDSFFQLGVSFGRLEKLIDYLLDMQILNRPVIFPEIVQILQNIEVLVNTLTIEKVLFDEIQDFRMKAENFLRSYKIIRSSFDNPIIFNFLHKLLLRINFWKEIIVELISLIK